MQTTSPLTYKLKNTLNHLSSALLLIAAFTLSGQALAGIGDTIRASVDTAGDDGNGSSFKPALSANGRIVAFESDADNLVAGDGNGVSDIFVRNLDTGSTVRVSVSSAGVEGNDDSFSPALSANGRIVAFESDATNLTGLDIFGARDIFVHDLDTGITTKVSGAVVSGLHGDSRRPALSADGRIVAFDSFAKNLVVGDTNSSSDIFVRNLDTGTTTRVSVASNGTQAINGGSFSPALSADGRIVAFSSDATNLVGGDGNSLSDVFVRDLDMSITTRVSVASNGAQAINGGSFGPALSADGRIVAFESAATNLVGGDSNATADIFVHNLDTDITIRVSVSSVGIEADGVFLGSFAASLSANGRIVAFASWASNLVAGDDNSDGDVFVRNLDTDTTIRVSVTSAGAQAIGEGFFGPGSTLPSLSADGHTVAFESKVFNLVGGDSNNLSDVFVRQWWAASADANEDGVVNILDVITVINTVLGQ